MKKRTITTKKLTKKAILSILRLGLRITKNMLYFIGLFSTGSRVHSREKYLGSSEIIYYCEGK